MGRARFFLSFLLVISAAGCAAPLLRGAVCLSKERWDLVLVKLTQGPDQYNTAGGCRVPREGKSYVWATVKIRNRLKTDQRFCLDRIKLCAGGRKIRPCIIDMDAVVTMRANPSPRLRPGEMVSRNLVYMVRRGSSVEAMEYENAELVIPATGAR